MNGKDGRATRGRFPKFAPVLVLAGVAALVACTSSRAPEARVDSPALTSDLKATLARDENLSRATNVEVDPKTGVVTLTGRVDSPEDRENAGRLACSVKGVRVVYNVIQIQARAR